jgi:hypothetical protein
MKYAPLVLSLVNVIVDEVEAVDAIPLKLDAVIVPVDGLYVNGIVALSTNSGEDVVTVLLKGMKYDPLVLSLVNVTLDAVDAVVAFPNKSPLNSVQVRREVKGS